MQRQRGNSNNDDGYYYYNKECKTAVDERETMCNLLSASVWRGQKIIMLRPVSTS